MATVPDLDTTTAMDQHTHTRKSLALSSEVQPVIQGQLDNNETQHQ